jgi:P pilus assembly chaperone PapD
MKNNFSLFNSINYLLRKITSFSSLPTLLFILTISYHTELSAQGNLLVTPRRVVFEGSKKTMDINLANYGQDTAIYAISIVQIRMNDDGGFETITEPDPDQKFADAFIRYFPRSVTLGPNEAQVIKVQLIKTNELKSGEYRSHFYFRAVPKSEPLGEEEPVVDTTSISVKLTPIFGITIPVIIRVGENTTKVSLTDLEFNIINDTIPNVRFVFNRTGNMSVYGNLTVEHISPQGKVIVVGLANGVAVYTPNTIRRFQLNLNKEPGVDFRSGKLRVTYSASSDVKPLKYATAELEIQ